MLMMKSVRTAAPGTVKVAEIQRPAPRPRDLLVRVRAWGICGTDAAFVQMGGMPLGPEGQTASIPLGHEPAGEVIKIDAEVAGLKTGDRVIVNPQAAPSGIIGCGGTLGGMSEYLLIQNAAAGKSVAAFPDDLPFEVATLNEPMPVARHCVNRSQARTTATVVVFGAGPIGLGVVIWLKLSGVRQVAVADVLPARLQTALAVGADTVIDSAREDVPARLAGLHGHSTNALGAPRPDTDIYIEAVGAAAVVNTALRARQVGRQAHHRRGAQKARAHRPGRDAAEREDHHRFPGLPHRDLRGLPQIAEHQQRFSRLISHRVPFCDAGRAFHLALTPGAEKVIVTFYA
jgi:(R,R)-butanediol dehydrogenase/meso-butanediol dehydrogenase/diacetyl reductase